VDTLTLPFGGVFLFKFTLPAVTLDVKRTLSDSRLWQVIITYNNNSVDFTMKWDEWGFQPVDIGINDEINKKIKSIRSKYLYLPIGLLKSSLSELKSELPKIDSVIKNYPEHKKALPYLKQLLDVSKSYRNSNIEFRKRSIAYITK
jgi:hypothetical protein